MVFAHGFGCDQNMWRLLLPHFSSRFRTVSFDHVGSGLSDVNAYDREKYASLEGYAQDLLEVVEIFSDGPVILLSNALLHGCAASPVGVSAQSSRGELVLTVTNQGEPIAPENIPKVFEPFWRDSMSSARSGLGLGLIICSEIVKAHGGTLEGISTLDTGTIFAARLPSLPPGNVVANSAGAHVSIGGQAGRG